LQQLLNRFYTSVLRDQLFHYKKLHKPSTGLELHLSGENLNGENLNSIKSLEAPESDGTIFLLLLIQAKGLAILEEKGREEEKQKNHMQ
jgi:hypothetical protein